MTNRVHIACRDCSRCTNSGGGELGQKILWGFAHLYSLGLTLLLMKRCRGCQHPMFQHGKTTDPIIVQQSAPSSPPPPVRAAGWYLADADGQTMAYWDGKGWGPVVPSTTWNGTR